MKKVLTLLAAFTSFAAVAAEQPKQPVPTATEQKQPTMKLAVYDSSNKVAREIEGLKYSVSAKNQELCWGVSNMQFNPKNSVTEVFLPPKPTKFLNPNASVVVGKDGKTTTIHTAEMSSYNNEAIWKCWKFDNKDPKGTYQLKVQVNDIVFGPLSFEVVK